MLKISNLLKFSNKKSYAPRGYWPLGRKYKAHFYNRVVSMGGTHEFNHGLPTGYSDNLFGALSTSKPDFRDAPLSRDQVVNAKKREDMGKKVIEYLSYMNDATSKYQYLEQAGGSLKEERTISRSRGRRTRGSIPVKSFRQVKEDV